MSRVEKKKTINGRHSQVGPKLSAIYKASKLGRCTNIRKTNLNKTEFKKNYNYETNYVNYYNLGQCSIDHYQTTVL